MFPTPDLLFETPKNRVDIALLQRALVFGFSAGDTNRAFERAIENARCPVSSFRQESFARDLFVEEFIENNFEVRLGGKRHRICKPYVQRILCNPSTQPSVIEMRQNVVRELVQTPDTAARVQELLTALVALRDTLSTGDFSARVDPNQRRMEILRAFASIVTAMLGYAGSDTALRRLSDYAGSVVKSPGYGYLQDLLHYEDSHANVDVRLRLGSDGSVRHFEIVSHETAQNPLLGSWTRRVWQRLLLIVKGYRVTENEVLSRLVFRAFDGIKDAIPPLFQVLGDLEFYLGALSFWRRTAAAGYPACLPTLLAAGDSDPSTWTGLFNPFLVREGVPVVPIDVTVHPSSITIVTGPNSGGKTRLMQSVALAQLLAQSGLPVPAKAARVHPARGLFVSMLEDVRADQPEGRLGMELLRIRRLFEELHPGDVVVLDELCSGTNPSEGEEIFQLVLELLAQLRPQVWISTHFLQLAQRLASEQAEGKHPLLGFLQVSLDADERPTFHFEPGVATTSLARQTAARLGVTRNELQRLVTCALEKNG